jgi:VWFA-related protein
MSTRRPSTAFRRDAAIQALVSLLAVAAVLPAVPGRSEARPGSGFAPQDVGDRPQFEVAVDLMTVQVRVVGLGDELVSGLTVDDFTLMIEGEERSITVLYEVNLPPLPSETGAGEAGIPERPHAGASELAVVSSQPAGAERALPVAARRHFLLFFDFSNTSRVGVRKARSAARQFLDTYVRADDMVGVAAYSPATGLEFLIPFTGYHELAGRAVESFFTGRAEERVQPQFADVGLRELIAFEEEASGSSELGALLESAQAEQYAAAIASYLDSLAELGEALTAIQGQKHVVFFSRGFADQVWEMKEGDPLGGGEERETEVRDSAQEAAEALKNAGAAIHTFHPDNLPFSNVHDISQIEVSVSTGPGQLNRSAGVLTDRQFLNFIAEETGGLSTWYAGNLATGLEDLDALSRSYYVLGYQRQPDDPEVVSVEVACTFPETEVASAPTQLANVPAFERLTPMQRQLQLAEALEFGVDANRMSLELRVVPLGRVEGVGRYAVVLQVPMREAQRLARLRNDGFLQFEILGVAIDEEGGMSDFFRNGIRLNAGRILEVPDGFDMPFRYYNLFVLPPGQYRTKIVVREATVGQLTSRSVELRVPREGDEATAQPVIVGPLRIAPDRTSYLARGVDPASPPRYRQGLPLDYPFQVNGIELTPDVSPLMQVGESYELWISIGGVYGDYEAAALSAELVLNVVDSAGTAWEIDYFEPIDEELDLEAGRLNLLLWMSLPDDLAVGPHELRLRFTEPVTGQSRESSLGVNVVSG